MGDLKDYKQHLNILKPSSLLLDFSDCTRTGIFNLTTALEYVFLGVGALLQGKEGPQDFYNNRLDTPGLAGVWLDHLHIPKTCSHAAYS